MPTQNTLLLTRNDVVHLLSLDACIEAVEGAFRMHGERTIPGPGILGMRATDGGFHIKAGFFKGDRTYFAAKMNANFPSNKQRFGLPSIQGVLVLCDGENGSPLAIMDSLEITVIRTGAATAVAAKYLSRPQARVATICGCGSQGRIQLESLLQVRRLDHAFVYDVDARQGVAMAQDFAGRLTVEPIGKSDLATSVGKSDICVTCTPSKQFYLRRDDVRPGTFIAAVGADSEEKQELDPALFTGNVIVVDVLEQCATIGDLHHALDMGLIRKSDVHAELGEIVAGRKAGRTSNEETIIFDSTGMALQDAAAAALVYENALRSGTGQRISMAGM